MPSLLRDIETVPVGSLEFYPGNPRVGDVPLIAESLKTNDQYAPLVVQRSTRYVLAGNHTLEAAVGLGWPDIDVVFVDVDADRARKILLSANGTADRGGYNHENLMTIIAELDGDYVGIGWHTADIEDLADEVGRDAPKPPGDFPGYGDDIQTDYECPSCHYTWSGKPK